MRRSTRFLTALTAVALLTSAVQAGAQTGYVSTDRLGFNGSVTRYASQFDLLNNINGTTYGWPQRDLSVYFVENNAAFSGANPDYAIFLNVWWANGGNTPSNSNVGFIQLYDTDAATVASQSYIWTDNARTSFQFDATGGNSVYGCSGLGDCGRLFNGVASASGVIFHSYAIGLTASGLAPATFNPTTGVWESVSEATSVTGYMNGVVQNVSPTDVASNGWYAYNLAINGTSFAGANYPGDLTPSAFGSNVVATPEPASMTLFATGMIGLALVRRRRNRR